MSKVKRLPASRKSTRKGKYHIDGFMVHNRGAPKESRHPRWWYERICPGCKYVDNSAAKRCPRCQKGYPR